MTCAPFLSSELVLVEAFARTGAFCGESTPCALALANVVY
jgi:hypothetical protein